MRPEHGDVGATLTGGDNSLGTIPIGVQASPGDRDCPAGNLLYAQQLVPPVGIDDVTDPAVKLIEREPVDGDNCFAA